MSVAAMKHRPEHSTEFDNFESVARDVFQVSKAELKRRLEAEKLANKDKPKRGRKPKTSASAREVSEKG
jgi:hypothetical protein